MDYQHNGSDYMYSYEWGFDYYLYSIGTCLLLPIGVFLNAALVFYTLKTAKTRGEPWRWMVANAAIALALYCVLLMDEKIYVLFGAPALVTTPLCPTVAIIRNICGAESNLCIAFVAIERFHALRVAKSQGGCGKLASVLCMVISWLVLILTVIPLALVPPMLHGYPAFQTYTARNVCVPTGRELLSVHYIVVAVCSVVFLATFIGAIVFLVKKSTPEDLKRKIARPILALALLSFFFNHVPAVFQSGLEVPLKEFLFLGFSIFSICIPLIFLITLNRDGDISLRFWAKDAAEEIALDEENK